MQYNSAFYCVVSCFWNMDRIVETAPVSLRTFLLSLSLHLPNCVLGPSSPPTCPAAWSTSVLLPVPVDSSLRNIFHKLHNVSSFVTGSFHWASWFWKFICVLWQRSVTISSLFKAHYRPIVYLFISRWVFGNFLLLTWLCVQVLR